MPTFIRTKARLGANSYTTIPTGADAERIKAIAAAGSDLYHWFDVALTSGAHVSAPGSEQTRMMCMWDERQSRLDLVSSGNAPPLLVNGGNGAKALDIDNDAGTEYTVMGAEDNVSLIVPDLNEWSIVIVCRPEEDAINFITGYEMGADTAAGQFAMQIRYAAQSGFYQVPQLLNSGSTINRIYDFGREYKDRDHVLAIGFDTVNGLTLSENGTIRAINTNTTNNQHLEPLTDAKFQLFGIGNGVSSLNFDGKFYAMLLYRKNIFKSQYLSYHEAVVTAYCEKLGVAHAFEA